MVGAVNVVVNFAVFNALVVVLLRGSELKANVVATVVATTTSYLMNRGWTFRHRRAFAIPREYMLFAVFNAAGLAIELAVLGAAKYGLALTALWALNIAKLFGLGLGTVFRFWPTAGSCSPAVRRHPRCHGRRATRPASHPSPRDEAGDRTDRVAFANLAFCWAGRSVCRSGAGYS